MAIFVIGLLIYYKYGKDATRTGVLRIYGHRPALYLFYKKKHRKRVVANLRSRMLGNENSPEMLIEIGAAINKKEKLQTVNITEVPNQTFLEAFMQPNPKITSLERRIVGLAREKNIDIDFEAVVTHDLANTIHDLSDQTSCER